MDALSVITEATKNHIKELANLYEVSLTRMYEILGKDCVYPKFKKLLRRIAQVNKPGVHLIKADLEALFCEILDETSAPSDAELHKELNDVITARLEKQPKCVRARHVREAMAVLEAELIAIEGELIN